MDRDEYVAILETEIERLKDVLSDARLNVEILTNVNLHLHIEIEALKRALKGE